MGKDAFNFCGPDSFEQKLFYFVREKAITYYFKGIEV